SDVISSLETPSGPLWLLPYPPSIVDMGQYLARFKEATDLERLWLDYVGELVQETAPKPHGDATFVWIGIHPFVGGTQREPARPHEPQKGTARLAHRRGISVEGSRSDALRLFKCASGRRARHQETDGIETGNAGMSYDRPPQVW